MIRINDNGYGWWLWLMMVDDNPLMVDDGFKKIPEIMEGNDDGEEMMDG